MDILIDKNYFKPEYICRHSTTPYYYNIEDGKYMFGVTGQMYRDLPYTIHKIKQTDTLDYLALKYYNNPTYFWFIAYFNDIDDAFMDLYPEFKTIKIPNIANVRFGMER